MHPFLIVKVDLNFKENKFFITYLYLHEMLNSDISIFIFINNAFWNLQYL
jgi:hypothetical protein